MGESAGSALWMNNNDVMDDECPPYSSSLAAPPTPAQQKAQVSYGFGDVESHGFTVSTMPMHLLKCISHQTYVADVLN